MNFGYLIIVSSNNNIDYLKLAYALALSIKNTQRDGYGHVALIIDDTKKIKDLKSPWVFDHVIEWNKETFWDGRSWMNKLSPFEYTVCLDADMLFTRDYSHWIDYFIENSELYIAPNAYTYRGELITNDFYRRAFTDNSLPNLYSFYTFFKQDSKLVEEFFSLGRWIIKNPTEFSNLYLSNRKPKVVGTDEAFALSAKLLGIENEISYNLEFPKVVHMKSMVQNWPWPANEWTDHIGFYLNVDGHIKLGNYQQYDIVHYVEKDKINKEMINILEELVWKK